MTIEENLAILSDYHLENIYQLVSDIELKLHIQSSSHITVSNRPHQSTDETARKDAIDYLEAYSIIELIEDDSVDRHVSTIPGGVTRTNRNAVPFPSIRSNFTFSVNIQKFEQFKRVFGRIYSGRHIEKGIISELPNTPSKTISSTSGKTDKTKSVILYEINFNMNYEIFLNEHRGKKIISTLISKPHLNRENTEVFSYIYNKPEITISKKEIEKSIGKSIGKDFDKILENLRFTKDLRKTFFLVSSKTIFFRKTISKSDFESLGISPLKIVRN